MKAALKILLGVLVTALVGALSIPFDILPGSAITAQMDLQQRVDQKLASDGFAWAQVTIDGQKAVISGNAPSHQEFENALAAVSASAWGGGVIVGGVTTVDSAGILDPERLPLADPYLWIAERENGAVVITGYAPSENARTEIFQLARNVFPGAEISGALDLAGGSPPEGDWLIAVSTSLHALARLEVGAVEANGAKFVLTGAANSEERADVLRGLMSALPAGMMGVAEIDVRLPNPSSSDAAAGPGSEAAARIEHSPTTDAVSAAIFSQAATDACRTRLQEKISARGIGFSLGSVDLAAASRSHLLELAGIMRECPQFSFEITGHTDSTGGEATNRRLSQRRADAVRGLLVESGVAARRFSVRGAGSSEPLADNTTLEGRRRNRRIEMDLIFDPQ